jgi:DnaJ-class molecular chaperone
MKKERCPNCRGTGKWYELIEEKPIRRVRQHQCQICEGTGKVLVPEFTEEEITEKKGENK